MIKIIIYGCFILKKKLDCSIFFLNKCGQVIYLGDAHAQGLIIKPYVLTRECEVRVTSSNTYQRPITTTLPPGGFELWTMKIPYVPSLQTSGAISLRYELVGLFKYSLINSLLKKISSYCSLFSNTSDQTTMSLWRKGLILLTPTKYSSFCSDHHSSNENHSLLFNYTLTTLLKTTLLARRAHSITVKHSLPKDF